MAAVVVVVLAVEAPADGGKSPVCHLEVGNTASLRVDVAGSYTALAAGFAAVLVGMVEGVPAGAAPAIAAVRAAVVPAVAVGDKAAAGVAVVAIAAAVALAAAPAVDVMATVAAEAVLPLAAAAAADVAVTVEMAGDVSVVVSEGGEVTPPAVMAVVVTAGVPVAFVVVDHLMFCPSDTVVPWALLVLFLRRQQHQKSL